MAVDLGTVRDDPTRAGGEMHLLDAIGAEVVAQESDLACPARATNARSRGRWTRRMWTAETPYLYTLLLSLIGPEGVVLEVSACR